MTRAQLLCVYAAVLVIVVAVQFGLALAGEPRSVWLFRLLGVL